MAESPQVTGGVTTWAQAVAGPLAEATCLWQDLDGLHVAAAPADPPPTSILWGWTGDGTLLRARLDGDTVYLAQCAQGAAAGQTTLPWNPGDGRVAAYRGVDAAAGGLGTSYVEVTVHPDGPDGDHGSITFIHPALPAKASTVAAAAPQAGAR